MSFVDHVITRRHFEARYNQVGRIMLADLAEIYAVDFDLAERWADEIDGAHRNIAGGGFVAPDGQGGGVVPSQASPPPVI